MTFHDFASAQSFLLWSTFAIAVVLGAVVNKTNFCTMGAVSDWVNMGDTGRLRAWVLWRLHAGAGFHLTFVSIVLGSAATMKLQYALLMRAEG